MLGDLTAGALADAARRRETVPLAALERRAAERPPALDALAALAPAERVRIIAEVKRSSPSRGALAEIPDPALLAGQYELGGASAISVLTEERRFVDDRLAGQVIGSPSTVRAGVAELVERTGVDELMVVTSTYDGADRLRSYRLLAEAVAAPDATPATDPDTRATTGTLVG